jgi:hypothetical protein
MCVVPSAPGTAGVRVWHLMSRGRGPRTGPPPEGVHVTYPHPLLGVLIVSLHAVSPQRSAVPMTRSMSTEAS